MAENVTSTPIAGSTEKPAWFDATFIGAVFAVVVLPNSMHVGFLALVLNVIAIACFVAPLVAWRRESQASREVGLRA